MSLPEIPENLFLDIKKAMEGGNKRKLNSLLGSQFHPKMKASLDTGLKSSTGHGAALFRLLARSLKQPSIQRPLSIENSLRALLMVSPLYETPFEAAHEFLLFVPSLQLPTVCRCVSAIEQFLRETRNLWQSKFNPQATDQHGSRAWLEKLAQATVGTIYGNASGVPEALQHRNIGTPVLQLVYGLLQTILALTRALDIRCFESVLDKAFFSHMCPSNIVNMLRLALASVSFLRENDIERIRQLLLADLSTNCPVIVSLSEIPTIVGLSINLTAACIAAFDIDEKRKETIMMRWKELVHRSLSIVAMNEALYASAEEQMQQALKHMDLRTFQFWCHRLKAPPEPSSNVKPWITFNVASLSLQTLYSSGTSTLRMTLGSSMRRAGHEDDLRSSCCNSILSASNPHGEDGAAIGHRLGLHGDLELTNVLDGVSYSREGSFVDRMGCEVEILSDIGKVLYKSLHLEQRSNQQTQNVASTRAWRLTEVTKHVLEQKRGEICIRGSLFGFVAMAVVYLEAPSCRGSLVRTIQEFLCDSATTSNTFSRIHDIASAAVNTIIGSLLPRDDDDVTDAVHKKFKMLDPLCDLLSESLPNHVFLRLVGLEMSSIPLAREFILKISKHLTAPVYIHTCNADENSSCNSQTGKMRAGILGLLELVRRSSWATVELEAWTHFSNALVFDKPSLSLLDRAWLYEQLTDLIEHEEISRGATFHLLRAALTRLSFFFKEASEHDETHFVFERVFVLWPDPNSPQNQKATQLEDIVALNRLVYALLYYASAFYDGNSDVMLYFARGREVLLYSVLSRSQKSLYSKEKAIEDFFQEICSKRVYSDKLEPCFSLAICQFKNMLETLVGHSGHRKETEKLSSMGPLVEAIVSEEVKQLQSYSQGAGGDHTLPMWLGEQGLPCWISGGRPTVDNGILFPLKSSMLDFSIDLLFTPPIPCTKLQKNTLLSRRIVLAAGKLVQAKKSAATIDAEDSLLVPRTVNNSAAQFFSASSGVIQGVVTERCTLVEANDLLAPILQYCQSVAQLNPETSVIASRQLLESVWSLYLVLGGERAAVRFIAYLEGISSSESETQSENDSSICSLLSVHTVDDVDEIVQKIRLHVVGALNCCLSSLASTNQVHCENLKASTRGLDPPYLNTSVTSGRLGSILSALSTDLRTGLDGKSGGITRKLYLAYMVSIEECAISLYWMRYDTGCSSTISCFREVSEVLSDVIATFFLDDPVLFRTTFLIATASLPAMCREIVRRAFIHGSADCFTDLGLVFGIDNILVSGTLSDSITILSRWSALRDPNSIPWSDIAGSFHLESQSDDGKDRNSQSDEKVDVELEIPRIVHIPREAKGNCASVSSSTRKIRFKTREAWSWALSCSLLALDEKWQEVARVLGNIDLRDSCVRLELKDWCFDFYEERKSELFFSLQNTCKFFSSTTTETRSSSAVPPFVLEMFAMNLPSAPRLRFCGLLLNIVKGLHYSLDILQSKLQFASNGSPETANHLGFFEAACCLSSWLCADLQEPDVTVGIYRWQSILERKLPRESTTAGTNVARDLLARLGNLVSLVDQLQTKLLKLDRLLRENIGSISAFDIFFQGGILSMSSLMAKKLSLLKREIPVDRRLNLLPDFPESSDDTERKKKRARQAYKPKRKKAPVVRSRNRVVDMFSHLDEVIPEGPAKKGDAFVDLEDFLVEG